MSSTITLFEGPLRRDQFLRFAHAHSLCVQAREGTLWLTVDGQREDVELDPGHSRCFDNRQPLVIGVLGAAAVLRVTGRVAPRWHERLATTLAARLRLAPPATS